MPESTGPAVADHLAAQESTGAVGIKAEAAEIQTAGVTVTDPELHMDPDVGVVVVALVAMCFLAALVTWRMTNPRSKKS